MGPHRGAPDVPPGIAAEIATAGGRVTFARFMELALTHPTEGYYSKTGRVLGPGGDFTTAPRISQAFGDAMGRLLEELADASLAQLEGTPGRRVTFVELGGGEADLARALLTRWSGIRPDLRDHGAYIMVEIGQGLRTRQSRALAAAAREGWQLSWAGSLAEAAGEVGESPAIIFGNEFIDALPVHLVDVRGREPLEAWAVLQTGGEGEAEVREEWGALSAVAAQELVSILGSTEPEVLRPLSRDGILEVRPAAGQLMRQAAACGRTQCLLTVDYGEWFATAAGAEEPVGPCDARRSLRHRTVRGYFRHQLVGDLYTRVGRQDITADVDFVALDRHGRRTGFETVLFSTVAGLLRADGAEGRLERLRSEASIPADAALDSDLQGTALASLLAEEGPGGSFKMMLQARDPEAAGVVIEGASGTV